MTGRHEVPPDNGTQTSWGLWQIISNGTHAAPSPNWADPVVNARLAVGKLNSQGLTAWGTYTSGAYKTHLPDKTAPETASAEGQTRENDMTTTDQATDLRINWTALRTVLTSSLTICRNLVAEGEAKGYLRSTVAHYEGRCEGIRQALDAMDTLEGCSR